MGQTKDKYIVRFPDGMRDEITASAKAKGRSINAEIIALLSGDTETAKLRDTFAAHALSGLYASRELQLAVIHDSANGLFEETMARQAYLQADAMIRARKAGTR